MSWNSWWSFSVRAVPPSVSISVGMESAPGALPLLSRWITFCILFKGSRLMTSSLMVEGQSAQPISPESSLYQWSVLTHLHWEEVMILRWWSHRLLSGHHRSSTCCSYLQSLVPHLLCCLAMNPTFSFSRIVLQVFLSTSFFVCFLFCFVFVCFAVVFGSTRWAL